MGHTPDPQSPIAQPLRSKRLTLRAATAEDSKTTFEYRRLDTVGEWLTELPSRFETYERRIGDTRCRARDVV